MTGIVSPLSLICTNADMETEGQGKEEGFGRAHS